MRSFFLNNIRLKLFALALAGAAWYAIRETISFETVISNVPIQIEVGTGWAVLDLSENTANVTLRGAQEDIRQIDRNQIKVTIDLSANSIIGATNAIITPDNVRGTRSVRVIRVDPERIGITLDREAEKLVSVNSRTIGKPFYGEVEQIICEPATVLIRGPARQLERTEWVHTEPVDVDKRVQSFTKRSHVLPPSAIQPFKIDPPDVLVHVTITEKSESLEWNDVPVLAIVRPGSNMKAEITPSRVNVKVTGRADVLANMSKVIPRVFVDCTDIDSSLAYDLPVNIHLPAGHEVSTTATPSFVHVITGK